MRKNLTPDFIKKLRPPATGRDEYWDTKQSGLCLRVTATGHKSWLIQYRAGGRGGKVQKKTLDFSIGLDAARKQAKKILGDVAAGADPVQEAREEKERERQAQAAAEEAEHTTVKAILESYLAIACGMKRDGEGTPIFADKRRTTPEKVSAYERFVYPQIGAYQITTLTRSRITAMLDKIAKENGAVMADRTLSYLSAGLTWHAARVDNWVSPIVRGMARTKPRQRAGKRVLDDQEIRDVWAALDVAEKTPPCYRAYVRTLLLTALRRTECSHGVWAEIATVNRYNIDGFRGIVWTIPEERMKNHLAHAVPLTDAALSLIGHRPAHALGDYIFSNTGGKLPFSGYSKAKAALDAAVNAMREKDGRGPMPAWNIHDLRRTAKTLMARAGVRPHVSERVLSHVIAGVEGVYDCYEYLDEKRDALERLAALVDRIIHPAANVTAFPQPSAATG